MQNLQGLSPLNYSLCYATSCAGFMVGGAVATRAVVRLGLDRTAGVGALILTLAGAGMIASTAYGVALPVTMTISMSLYLCGMGLCLSQVVAAAMTPFPHSAGTASSLIGFVQQCSGALMGALVGGLLGTTPWPVAIGVAVAGSGSLILWLLTRRLRLSAA
jgi:DHA1 family bicyclomycin/chloramphenicol resistance-like MFS transporter